LQVARQFDDDVGECEPPTPRGQRSPDTRPSSCGRIAASESAPGCRSQRGRQNSRATAADRERAATGKPAPRRCAPDLERPSPGDSSYFTGRRFRKPRAIFGHGSRPVARGRPPCARTTNKLARGRTGTCRRLAGAGNSAHLGRIETRAACGESAHVSRERAPPYREN